MSNLAAKCHASKMCCVTQRRCVTTQYEMQSNWKPTKHIFCSFRNFQEKNTQHSESLDAITKALLLLLVLLILCLVHHELMGSLSSLCLVTTDFVTLCCNTFVKKVVLCFLQWVDLRLGCVLETLQLYRESRVLDWFHSPTNEQIYS